MEKKTSKSGKKTQALRVVVTVLIVGVLLYLGQVIYLLRADSPRGFVLPKGDAVSGRTTFVELGCIQCHTVWGTDLPSPENVPEGDLIQLGGNQGLATTYGQLVTSIMHPSSELHLKEGRYIGTNGDSLMPDYKSNMTVEELVNLVMFLQDHYNVVVPHFDPMSYYSPYVY